LKPFAAWRWAIGVAILVALVALVVSRFAEETEFFELARRAQPWWLSLAALLQAGTYLCAAAVLRHVGGLGRGPAPHVRPLIAIFEALASAPDGLGVSDLARRLAIPKSSTWNLVFAIWERDAAAA
jgi:hypothetical protein